GFISMPFFSISSLSAWTSFCCRCRRASSDVTRPWKSALARLPASHSLSARCTSTYANFSSARAGTAADITASDTPNIAPMNNRCLIQPGKPPVDYLANRETRPDGATRAREIYTIVLHRASNPVAGRFPCRFRKKSNARAICGLQRRAGPHFEHRALVGWTRVEREGDVHRQRPKWRFPAHAESNRCL